MSLFPMPVGTAIDVPGGSGNGYDITSPTALDGGAGFEITILTWFFPNSIGANRRLVYKQGVWTTSTRTGANAQDVEWEVGRATTGMFLETDSGVIAAGAWRFLALTYSESDAGRAWFGDINTNAVETAYGTRNVGAGNTSSNTNTINLWYRAGSNRTHDGRFAYMHIINRRLTLDEIIQLQWNPGVAVAGTQILYHPGSNESVVTLKDRSGNGNDATQVGTGQALALGAPIGYRKRRRSGLYTAIAAPSGGPVAGIADFDLPSLTVVGAGGFRGIADFDLPNLTVNPGIGEVAVAGVADFPLPNLTITGVGDIPIAGVADFPLPNMTIIGIGDIPIDGVADFPLPNLTVNPGIGTVGSAPISGIADFDLPNLTITGAGDIPVDGIADFNLPNLTITSFGTVAIDGVADFNLPVFTITGIGIIGALGDVLGIADFNLPSLWVQTQGGVDIPMVNIFSTTGQTGAETGAAFTLSRRAGVWLINRDVLAQTILGAGSATINIEASLDGGTTFANLVTAQTGSALATITLPPLIRVRLSAATGATVDVYLDADLVLTRTDN